MTRRLARALLLDPESREGRAFAVVHVLLVVVGIATVGIVVGIPLGVLP